MKPLITPTVNLNGSDAGDLLQARIGVRNLLEKALHRMAQARPHGRDYQHLIKGSDWAEHHATLRDAQDAWQERMEMLQKIADDLLKDAIAIDRQKRGSRS